jgi:hypothetical protein
MALMDFIKKQFIDIIQWTEDDGDTMAWRFPMAECEIQNGASLTVRESQMAVFVNEGTVADVFGPGMYKLTTQTLPVLTYLKNWDKLFESPFKSDVYFLQYAPEDRPQVGHAESGDDPRQGFRHGAAARLRHLRLPPDRPQGLPHHAVGHAGALHGSEQLEGQLRNTIVGHISDIFGESGVPFIDMAGEPGRVRQCAEGQDGADVRQQYGLALDSLNVQNISLPEELQAMLDKRIGVNMMGGMQAYTQFQTAEAIPLAAQNEGGLAGIGAGLGVGLGARPAGRGLPWRRRFESGGGPGRSPGRRGASADFCGGTGFRRRDRRHHRKTARTGGQGHAVASRVRREEGGAAEEGLGKNSPGLLPGKH